MAAESDAYDVVIIGAGIGGLVCGCYLAKAGMKVLIAEQHFKPGGYCTSFTRKGFTFDAAAHSFGGYREGGIVKKVVSDLKMENRLHISKNDPSDTIIAPDCRLSFWSDIHRTVEEFMTAFPEERLNIKSFFEVMGSVGPHLFVKMRRWTFLDFLERCFRNEKLKAVLAFPLFTNGGLPPSMLSFCSGATIFSEFLMDGGYYPKGGMQALPDAFAETFKTSGGELRLSCRIKKISLRKGMVTGIITEENEPIRARYIISNGDARETFFSLVGGRSLGCDFRAKIKTMIPSSSYVAAYLGLNRTMQSPFVSGTTVGYLPHYDLGKMYRNGHQGRITNGTGYIMRFSSDANTLTAIAAAPYKNEAFWKENKKAYGDALVKHIDRTTVPGLMQNIEYQESATPLTFRRYTSNYRGAAYGWASLCSQFADMEMKKPPGIQNLFLTGHWTTQGIGITGVVYSGLTTAELVRKIHSRKVA